MSTPLFPLGIPGIYIDETLRCLVLTWDLIHAHPEHRVKLLGRISRIIRGF
jgi:hypothetical protein